MTAARIGPLTAGIIFRRRAPLQQDFAFIIADEHRHCTMQGAGTVGLEFLRCAERRIVAVDEDHVVGVRIGVAPDRLVLYPLPALDFVTPVSP